MSIGKCCTFRILPPVLSPRETGARPRVIPAPQQIENLAIISLFGTVALLLSFCMMGAALEHDAIGVAIVRHRGCVNSERLDGRRANKRSPLPWTGAPRSQQRTWAEEDGAQPLRTLLLCRQEAAEAKSADVWSAT
jgi:hypothetical protein